MKNIHTLQTDKPSRLVLDTVNNNLFATTTKDFGTNIMKFQNIYITSDEEAKEGDWGYIPFQGGNVKLVGKYFADDWKKIILTTDQDLIEDGVQAIDDEFLEWFVKNPSCEEVKWSAYPISPNGNIVATNRPYPFEGLISNFKIEYKIIIPKEKPKPEYSKIKEGLKKSIEGKEHFIQHFKNGGSVEDFKPLEEPQQETPESIIQDIATHLSKTVPETLQHIKEFSKELDKLKSKQETLEEAAKRMYPNRDDLHLKREFKDGAKWQQERMYSETFEFAEWCNDMGYTQVANSFWKSLNDEKGKTTKELFEQFKKK